MKIVFVIAFVVQCLWAETIFNKQISWKKNAPLCEGCIIGSSSEIFLPVTLHVRNSFKNVKLIVEGEISKNVLLNGKDTIIFSNGKIKKSTPFRSAGKYYQTFWIKVGSKKGSSNVWTFASKVKIVADRSTSLTPQKKIARKRFAKLSSSIDQSIEWLFQFKVGSEKSFGEENDGLYSVSYNDLKSSYESYGLDASKLSGKLTAGIRLWTGRQDTLDMWPLGENAAINNLLGPKGNTTELKIELKDGNNNKVFDEGDEIVFFGQASGYWKYDSLRKERSFHHSPWDNTRSYYLSYTPNGEPAKRVGVQRTPTTSQGEEYIWKWGRLEKDSLVVDNYYGSFPKIPIDYRTGIEWMWAYAGVKQQTSLLALEKVNSLNYTGLKEGAEAKLQVGFFPQRAYSVESNRNSLKSPESRIDVGHEFSLNLSGSEVVRPQQTDVTLAGYHINTTKLKTTGNSFDIHFSLPSGNVAGARFDGLSIGWRAKFADWVGEGYFYPDDFTTVKAQFSEDYRVLVLENGKWVDELGLVGNYSVNVGEAYFVSKTKDYKKPTLIPYQPDLEVISDLRNAVDGRGSVKNPKYIIITSKEFLKGALDLKRFRESDAYKTVSTDVVLLEDIYRDFSSGQTSPAAIRDFLRWAKFKWGKELRSALLLGGGHYDYRNIKSNQKSYFPVFTKDEISSDDYYALLDSGQVMAKRWGASLTTTHGYDIAVGRLPIHSLAEMDAYLAKLRKYEGRGGDYGPWRNKIILTADDIMQGTKPDEIDYHMRQSEELKSVILAENSSIAFTQVYLLDHPYNQSLKKPTAEQELIEKISKGALAFNYYGHGGAAVLADENLLRAESVAKINAEHLLPFFTAFSCVVGRYDQYEEISLSRKLFLADQSGVLSVFSATRDSYSSKNKNLSQRFFKNLLSQNFETYGESMVASKMLAINMDDVANDEKYNLLGEPELPLMRVTQGAVAMSEAIGDTLSALQKVRLKGKVSTKGVSKIRMEVVEQDRQNKYEEGSFVDSSLTSGNVLFAQESELVGGAFDMEFVSPKKLSFGDTNAQFRAWAWGENGEMTELFQPGISLEGTSTYADSINDVLAPEMVLFPCVERVGQRNALGTKIKMSLPACLEVHLSDSTGIDYSEAVDEGVNLELVGYKEPWHPSFTEQTGKGAKFKIELAQGAPNNTLLRVSAQDILGNKVQKEIELELTEEIEGGFGEVYNVPNPMKKTTRFFFNTQLAFDTEVQIKIYSQSGTLVRVLRNVIPGVTKWDGKDSFGQR
ncbi:C25 family cysteine peptidase, partial [Fibrobacterales bacterium]|nr:C25 family cysteine peptidase [Fibrobacterales bacterium]